jgi:hypothetical protein
MLQTLAMLLPALLVLPELALVATLFWAARQASRAGMMRAPRAPWRVVIDGRSLTLCAPSTAPVRVLFADVRAAREVDWDGFDVPRGWSRTLVLELTGATRSAVRIPLRGLLLEGASGLVYRNACSGGAVSDGGGRLVYAVRTHVAVEAVYLDSPVDGWV